MAAYDYTSTGSSTFTTHGTVAAPIGPLDTSVQVSSIVSDDGSTTVQPGTVILIGDEWCFVTSVDLPTLGIERGCADSIPEGHDAGDDVWFVESVFGSDDKSYEAGLTIGVKLPSVSQAGTSVPLEYAPPHALTFNWRHARPYPPGNFKCDGDPWFDRRFVMVEAATEITFTWAHRDRVLQLDQMIPHTASSVGPEPGTTYKAVVYDSTGVLRRTETIATGTTWLYSRAMAEQDFLLGPEGYIDFYSERGGLRSSRFYRTLIEVEGLTFGEDESEFNFMTAGYTPPTSDTIVNFINAGYVPPASE